VKPDYLALEITRFHSYCRFTAGLCLYCCVLGRWPTQLRL